MIDPSVFNSTDKPKLPIREVIQKNPASLFKIITLFSLSTISFYLGFVYITGYLVSSHQISLHEGLIDNAISTIFLALLIPAFGYLSDKISRQSMIIAATVFGGSCPLVATYLTAQTGSQVTPSIYPMLIVAIYLCFAMRHHLVSH